MMNVIICICLLFSFLSIELIGLVIWGKYLINKKTLIKHVIYFIMSCFFYLCMYIVANHAIPSFGELFSLNNTYLALYSGAIFHIIRLLFIHRSDIRVIFAKECISKYACTMLIIIGIVCIMELTIFNFRHYQSFFNKPVYPENYQVSENLSICDTNTYEVTADGETYIEVSNINLPIYNIHADYIFPQKGEYGVVEVNYHYSIMDQGNSASYYNLPSRTFYHLVPQSQYTHVNLYGNGISFRINFENLHIGDIISVRSLVLNARYPLMISAKRGIFLIFILMILYLLRPKSSLYKIRFLDQFKYKKRLFIFCLLIQAMFFWRVVNYNSYFTDPSFGNGEQYYQLTEALTNGHAFLDIQVPQSIINLEDPYDASLRDSSLQEGEGYPHDVAYYNGHYYVYFGVGPVIVFLLPYYMLTETHLPIHIALYMAAMLAVIAAMGLLSQIIKRWIPKTPLLFYLMFSCLFVNGCGLLFAMQRPDFYSLPIVLALASTLGGLYFWMKAIEREEVSGYKLFIGSFLMAFVAACRPQFLIGSFLAVILFGVVVFKERKLFSKQSIGNTVCFITPYILVAVGVMYYNAIRFGSVFDFGANYNLTYNNMQYRGWRLDRLLYSIFGFLFFPLGITNAFPFIEPSHYSSTYQGISVDDALTGGIIYNQIYLLPTLLIIKFKKYFSNIQAYWIAVMATIFAFVIMIVDAQMAGVLTRYFTDFTWLLMISGFIIISTIYQRVQGECHQYYYRSTFYICFILGMLNRLLSIYTDLGLALKHTNGLLFHRVAHLVEFWN